MKLSILLLGIISFCTSFISIENKIACVKQQYIPTNDSAVKSWIDDLRIFRNAVYRNDSTTLKTFFKFPVMNEANEIWYIVLTEKELDTKKISYEKIIPFTEKDFNKYYKKLFPKNFVKALMKIKTDELYKKGEATTLELKDETATSIKLYASYDKKKSVLTLNASYNSIFKDENGEVLDGGESSVIFTFRILKSNRLQFINVRLAG